MRHFLQLFLIRTDYYCTKKIATLVNIVLCLPKTINLQACSRELFPCLMSCPYNTQPWLVRCNHPPLCCVRAAICCSVLQCDAMCSLVCCSEPPGVLQCAAEKCSVLQCDAVCMIELVVGKK